METTATVQVLGGFHLFLTFFRPKRYIFVVNIRNKIKQIRPYMSFQVVTKILIFFLGLICVQNGNKPNKNKLCEETKQTSS